MTALRRLLPLALAALLGGAAAQSLRVPAGASGAVLTLPDGFKVTAELALDAEAQRRGLMFRGELKAEEGMLFVFPDPGPKSFWMKNTYIDLDMVFLDSELKVLRVFHRVPRSFPGQPESELARASSPASCVLELAAGTARKHKVKPGRKLLAEFLPPKKTAGKSPPSPEGR